VDMDQNGSRETPASTEGVLRRKVRAAIRAGVLPRHHQVPHLHIPCFAVWDLECRAFLQAGSDGGTIADRERVQP
jgi:hypothetical protein